MSRALGTRIVVQIPPSEWLMATSDTGGEVKEEDWTSSISIENERFAAYL
jgi:hypothetical protein